jgi:hypothetical protein
MVLGHAAVFRLRWRFRYRARPDRIGPWNRPSDEVATAARFQPLDGLLWALIEGEHFRTHETVTILEVPGADYREFQWVEAVPVRLGALAKGHELTQPGRVIGAAMLTDTERYEVLIDGRVLVTKLPVRPAEKGAVQ